MLTMLLTSGSFKVDLAVERDCFQVEEITARAEEAEKAQNTLASVFKISEGKAWRGNVSPERFCVQTLNGYAERICFLVVSQCCLSWDREFI